MPCDNKSEFHVVIDNPEGTTLDRTDAVTQEFAVYFATQPEVVYYPGYVATSGQGPFDGLVRHCDLRGCS
ncbi:hypothetical protein CSC81_16875, partial [Tenacibaculum discolor]